MTISARQIVISVASLLYVRRRIVTEASFQLYDELTCEEDTFRF